MPILILYFEDIEDGDNVLFELHIAFCFHKNAA